MEVSSVARRVPRKPRSAAAKLAGTHPKRDEAGNGRPVFDPGPGRRWLAFLVLAVPTGLALLIQLSSYPNHDVAWVLWGAREMLHGAEFGRDIIEPNPPLAWYLSMPTTALATALGVPLDWPFRIAVALGGAFSAMSLVWLRPPRLRFSHALVLAAVAAFATLTLMGREFGQREPLMIIMILPYLALSARRFEGAPGPGFHATLAIGAIAGLGFALKPYFLAVPLLVEAVLLLSTRGYRQLFRTENLSIAAVILAYGLWVVAFEQSYLYEAVPLAREIYWSFDRDFRFVLLPLVPLLVGVATFAFLAFQRKDGLGIMLSAAFLGFAFSYLVQAKGYDYHLLPARTLSLILAVRIVLDERTERRVSVAALAVATAFFALWYMQFESWWDRARPGGRLHAQIERINQSIERHAKGGRYLVIAIRTYPSFPAGIYAPARYVSRTNAQWFLPAVAQLRAAGRPSAEVEMHAREFILHDLRAEPDLVLLDTNSKGHTQGPSNFDFLNFYNEAPAFRAEWRHYREVERIGPFRQFVRVGMTAPTSADEPAGARSR